MLVGGADVSIPQAEPGARGLVFQNDKLSQSPNIRAARRRRRARWRGGRARGAVRRHRGEAAAGLDTVVGARGVYLSGGECQRIALARAILKDAPIVVLDEATAFADPENEALIQRALGVLCAGKTVLMIAHRLSTVAGADAIYVLDGGRLAEQGTHAELVEAGGLYARMWADYRTSAQWRIGKEGGYAA
ncbi:MAG: ATP-binding cassette domain-containing protein [Eggerthella lenta]